MIVEGFQPKSRRFPFLRTTWNSLQKYTNRSVSKNEFAGGTEHHVGHAFSSLFYFLFKFFNLIETYLSTSNLFIFSHLLPVSAGA